MADDDQTFYSRASLREGYERGRADAAFSLRAFGPNQRVAGRVAHLRKELFEIEASGGADPAEWVDVALLAFDGLLRIPGMTPERAAAEFAAKFARNQAREWPDWRTADPDGAIEHTSEPAGWGCAS